MSLSISGHSASRPVPLRATQQGDVVTSASPDTDRPASREKSKSENTTPHAVPHTDAIDRYTPAEKQIIEELKARDREVRAHEAAHMSAAGSLARSGPSYTYQRGPDGVSYAIGGEVQIDLSPVPGDPEASARKAQQIRAAALAPAQPSAQDYAVAAQAAQMAAAARRESKAEETTETSKNASLGSNAGHVSENEEHTERAAHRAQHDNRIAAYERHRQDVPLHGQLLNEMA